MCLNTTGTFVLNWYVACVGVLMIIGSGDRCDDRHNEALETVFATCDVKTMHAAPSWTSPEVRSSAALRCAVEAPHFVLAHHHLMYLYIRHENR